MSGFVSSKTQGPPSPAVESYLFGCELSSKTKQYTFQVDEEDDASHCVCLQTISLGAGAKDEHNVVEVTAHNYQDKEVTVPLANLKLSCQPMVNVEYFEIEPPVTFRLTSGSGPVFISGRHYIVINDDIDLSGSDEDDDDEDIDDDDDDDDDDDEEEEEVVTPIKPAKKSLKTLSHTI
ncbi:nucleoplasmin-3 [Xenopus tropicalis]|nr:nucleoplasmin-3 [Xenopus tropicalis]CAJ83631.1 nucleophosmin/nucleoplasmin, 3 [Xenopus tropicalis]|eukprot:NP_001016456.1 nucleoplasmin-3 [Xenopus tropicalis]